MNAHPTQKTTLKKALRGSRGASMVEYALLLFLILVVAYVAFQKLGKSVRMGADKADVAFMGGS